MMTLDIAQSAFHWGTWGRKKRDLFVIISIVALALAIVNFLQIISRASHPILFSDYLKIISHVLITHSLIPLFAIIVLNIRKKWDLCIRYIHIHLLLGITLSIFVLLLISISDFLFFYIGNWSVFKQVVIYHFNYYFGFIIIINWSILVLISWFDIKYEKAPTEFPAKSNVTDRMPLRHKGATVFIDPKEIIWVQAADNYVKVHLTQHFYVERIPLKEIAKLLPASQFRNAHRSAIVNINFIEAIHQKPYGTKTLKLKGGFEINLTKKYRKDFKDITSLHK